MSLKHECVTLCTDVFFPLMTSSSEVSRDSERPIARQLIIREFNETYLEVEVRFEYLEPSDGIKEFHAYPLGSENSDCFPPG